MANVEGEDGAEVVEEEKGGEKEKGDSGLDESRIPNYESCMKCT